MRQTLMHELNKTHRIYQKFQSYLLVVFGIKNTLPRRSSRIKSYKNGKIRISKAEEKKSNLTTTLVKHFTQTKSQPNEIERQAKK